MAKRKSTFEKTRATVLTAMRRFEKAVKEMVNPESENKPATRKSQRRTTKNRKNTGRRR